MHPFMCTLACDTPEVFVTDSVKSESASEARVGLKPVEAHGSAMIQPSFPAGFWGADAHPGGHTGMRCG